MGATPRATARAAPGATPRATARDWAGLAALVLPALLLSIDVTMLFLALPTLGAGLGADGTQQLWIMDAYGFMIAGFLVTMGTLGDRIGRRRLLLTGAAAFAALSALAAWSTGPGMLIVLRALLGIAGATIMPATLSLIRHMFADDRQRRIAIALWTAGTMGGMALGPAAGGLLLEHFWWGAAFLMAVPVMLLVLAAGPLLPEYRDPAPGRLDPLSVLLSLATMLPLVYAVKETARHGPGLLAAAALLVGLASGYLFVRRQPRLAAPLLDLDLLRLPAFGAALVTVLAASMTVGAYSLLLSQYLQLVKGLTPVQAGTWLVPNALVSIVAMLATPRLAARFGDRAATVAALAVAAAGFILLAQVSDDLPTVAAIAAAGVVSLGMSPLLVLVNNLVVGTAPKRRSASAAAMSETCLEAGAALGIAVLGSLAAFVYRAHMADGPAAARDSLAAAIAAGPPTHLLDAARAAFISGLTAVAYVSAGIALLLATLATRTIRNTIPKENTDA
ncbi:MFS transporter [Spirillospora sp. CA-255316]